MSAMAEQALKVTVEILKIAGIALVCRYLNAVTQNTKALENSTKDLEKTVKEQDKKLQFLQKVVWRSNGGQLRMGPVCRGFWSFSWGRVGQFGSIWALRALCRNRTRK